MCVRLRITINILIAFHSFINEQTERVDQNVERYLHTFYNFVQNT